MRSIFLSLLTNLLLFSNIWAQEDQVETKYWIFLQDKKGAAGKVADVEFNRLSPAALSRRYHRASHIHPDRDAPLSTIYLQSLGAHDVQPLVQSRWLNAVSAFLTSTQVQEILRLPFVKSVRPVARLELQTDKSFRPVVEVLPGLDFRERYRFDYGPSLEQLQVVNAIPPLEEGLKGAGVKLGIIDTGMGDLPSTHPATALMMEEGRFVRSQNFTQLADDNSRHGYSVLSVAAGYDPGQLVGPAYGAEIYHARTEYTPSETNQEEDNFVAGIEWMEAEGVDVVNISLGYSLFDTGQHSYTVDDLDGDTGVTTIAADMAVEMGMVVVSSAGNSGCMSPEACWYYVTMPADGDHVIAVGAVDVAGNLVGFSSRGPTADGGIKPELVAQGASVYVATAGSAYQPSNGTSFSSPMVAGIVALMLEANPDLTPADVRLILKDTASQADAPDNNLGWGIVDAEAAVNAARERIRKKESDLQYFAIDALYPNPFTVQTSLLINNEGPPVAARLVIYNALGQTIYTPFDDLLSSGRHRITIDLSEHASGLYYYRLETNGVVQSGTLVHL